MAFDEAHSAGKDAGRTEGAHFKELPKDSPGGNEQSAWNKTLARLGAVQRQLDSVAALVPTADHDNRGELQEKHHPLLHNDREYLKKIPAEERLRLLTQVSEGKELTPKQTLRIQEFDLIKSFAEVLAASRPHDIPAVQGVYGGPLQWISEHTGDLVLQLVRDPDASFKKILPGYFLGLFDKMHIPLDPISNPQELLSRQNLLVTMARENRCYTVAEDVTNKAVDEEFKQGERQLAGTKKDELRVNAERIISGKITAKTKLQWVEKGIDAKQADEIQKMLVEIEYQHSLHSEIAGQLFGKTIQFSGVKAQLWEQYNDMLDPHSEWFNLKDSTWDTIRDEVINNAPFILVSGGAANLIRAGISVAAREAIVRKIGELSLKKLAQRTVIKTATTAAQTLVKDVSFDVISKILHGEWYKNLPNFARSVLLSSATFGLFHGAGKLDERFFSKEIAVAGEKLTVQTALGKEASRIKNPAVQEAIKQLVAEKHVEVAAMLFISSVQNGLYEGNSDEFLHNLGDELLHAYVSVGALKIGGAAADEQNEFAKTS